MMQREINESMALSRRDGPPQQPRPSRLTRLSAKVRFVSFVLISDVMKWRQSELPQHTDLSHKPKNEFFCST